MSADESDVDAELLAMAGDSDDDESEAGEIVDQTQVLDGPRTPSEEPKPSVEKVAPEEPPSARRGVAQKVKKSRKKRDRDRRREIEDELDDLGDGSPSPLPSPAMSESGDSADAPASPDAIDDGPLYPLEGKFTSESDRKEILSLPEIDRESILAERATRVLERQQDIQLRKALATSQAAASKQKRKASAADLDDAGLKRSSRPKTGKSALDNYKKAREAKGAERTSRLDAGRDRGRRSRSTSSASGPDADGESEVEWADQPSSSRRDKEEPLAELKDFDRCRIGRSAFAKVHFYPDFERTMTGCFARVSIGMNRETGQNMYRMTQVKGFTQGKPYQLEAPNGKTFHTDLYALVAQGSAEKPWPFSACSDSPFTDAEFQRYQETLEKERVRIPKRRWLLQKLDDIHAFLTVQWSDGALKGKFDRQREMEKRVDPANAANIKRQAIIRRKQEAEDVEDVEKISRCEAELAALDNTASSAINGAKSSPLKTSAAIATVKTQQERLAQVNAKNRGRNADDVRKALLEERKKLQREREKALAAARAKAAAEEEKKLLAVPDMSDLFGSDVSRAGTPMSGTSTPRIRRSRAGTPMMGLGKKEKSGLGLVIGAGKKGKAASAGGDDELGGLDLGIDVEI